MPAPQDFNLPNSVSSVSSVVNKPLIGLTCRWDAERGVFDLPADYAEAVAAAGGIAVQIPLIAEDAAALAERLDGIILSGSPSDVDPRNYGAQAHKTVTNIAAALDSTCFALLDHAERTGVPVLGICYGMQVINVHRGGTLIQHIPAEVPDALQHQNREGRHEVTLTENSRLAALTDSAHQTVNSTHHQAVARMGRDLTATARAADGVIEAFECAAADRFLMAVQWHPERIWREHPLSAKLFQELTRNAGEFRRRQR